ncbi:DNA polymerase III subunit delta' [Microbaculum marinum]|uniref:DNA polymerase III subunit delta n=1 Tax=Microbaculum marinum TaxID=1764581 RepID=A0AAW9S041_9HYPH
MTTSAIETFEPPEAASVLLGHVEAESALLNAYRSDRLHHAWLIEGPEGVGKATLAYRFARFLLRHPDPANPAVVEAADLSVAPDDPVARQFRARSNPDLVVLQRPRDEDGKFTATVINVDAVRRIARFLSTTSASGGWRVVIVDSADDFNRSSANALLKMLEEPPQRSVFLLLSNTPGRLLPTIRSRCRRLVLKPLRIDEIASTLRAAGLGRDDGAREMAARLSGGSLGKAIELVADDAVETVEGLFAILDRMPGHDPLKAQKFAEAIGRRGAEARYALATSLIYDWLTGKLSREARAGADAAVLAPWAEVWEKVTRALSETERLNLDRTQTLLSVFRIISAAASQDAARV